MQRQSTIKYNFVLVDGEIYRVEHWLGSRSSTWLTRLEAEANLHFNRALTDEERAELAEVITQHDAPQLVGRIA